MEVLLSNIEVIEALEHNSKDVSELVKSLLIELAPSVKEEIENSSLDSFTKDLLSSSKIWAFLAKKIKK
jgi:hypothetical protein